MNTVTNQDAAEAMDTLARISKRDGESKQTAYARLLESDPLMKRLNAIHRGADADAVSKAAIVQQVGPDAIRKRATELQAANPTMRRERAMEVASSEHKRKFT